MLLLAVFGAGAAMAAERRETVPAPFAGEWVADLKQCGTGRGDSRPQLDADRIRFRESGGPIRAVVARGEFEIALIAGLSGEGETPATPGESSAFWFALELRYLPRLIPSAACNVTFRIAGLLLAGVG